MAASRHQLSEALELLLLATGTAMLPLLAWLVHPAPARLVLAAFFWFISGYYFAVGMWI